MMPRIDTGPVTLSPAGGGAMAPGGDARQAALQGALAGLVGQSLPAEVLSNFTDGSSLVKIAGLNVRLMLPPGVAVGSDVPLTVIAASPRPTFQFGSGGASDLATLLYSETGATPGGSAAAAAAYGALASQDTPLPGAARPPSGAAPTAAETTTANPDPAAPAGTAAGSVAGAAAQAGAATGTGAGAAAQSAYPAGAGPAAADAGTLANPADATPASPAGNPAADSATNAAADPAANPETNPTANPATNPAANPATNPAGNPATSQAAKPGGATATPPSGANAVLAAIAAAGVEDADGATPAAAVAPGAAAMAAADTTASGAAATAQVQKPPSLAAALLGRAPLTPSNQLPDLNAGTPGAALSSTARALTIMLSAAQSLPGTPMVLTGKTPLVADGPPVAEQLAKTLQNTVSQSGLFYESHVSDWVKGELSLPDLTREPQMQRMLEAAAAAPRPADAGPDLGAAQMVNLQLHTQEQARVQWNGQAWPGQNMQWDIRREQRQGGRGGDADSGEPEQIWRSGVRFRFQMLGEVSAAVTIVGDQVHIQVVTDSDGAAATLRSYAGELETAMAAAGAPLSSLAIAADT